MARLSIFHGQLASHFLGMNSQISKVVTSAGVFFFPDLFAVLRQERFKRTSHLFSCSPARNTTWAITIHGRVKVLTVLQTPRPDRKHGKAYSPLLSVLSLCAARYCWYTGTYSYIRMPIKTELGITAMEGMVSKLKMETNVGLKRRSVCRYYPDF